MFTKKQLQNPDLQYAENHDVPVTLHVQGAGAVTEIDCWNRSEAPAPSWEAGNGKTMLTARKPGLQISMLAEWRSVPGCIREKMRSGSKFLRPLTTDC